MKVAVYSGSFNPLHIGHQAILEYLTREAGFDKTYLIVSPHNPFKDPGLAESGPARVRAAEQALARHPEIKAEACDIELRMPPPQYTIRTLDALQKAQPDTQFTLIIGADNLPRFREWREYQRLLLDYGIAVYPRQGYDSRALRNELMAENGEYKIALLDAPTVDVSSSQIRAAIAEGSDVSSLLM